MKSRRRRKICRPHTAQLTMKKNNELGWELFTHPPYYPDLAPRDYHLFSNLKNGELEKRSNGKFIGILKRSTNLIILKGFEILREHSVKCVDFDGNYDVYYCYC